MTTTYLNVSTASQLSADIKAIDLASQADGGNGTHYVITLKAGATLDGKRRHFRDQPRRDRHADPQRPGRDS